MSWAHSDAMPHIHHQRYLIIGGAACAAAAASVVYSAVWSLRGSKSIAKRTEPKRILLTGAAGQIAYALAPLIASGQMLGPDQPVVLQLYDVPAAAELLEGLQLELQDAAYPLLHGVTATTNFAAAAHGVSIAVLCGGVPKRGSDPMTKVQLMAANCAIYRDQAAALAAHAAPGVKVVVVASPANTNAWLLQQYAPSIPKHDITALTRLDHNRAMQHLASVLNVAITDISNVIIWGNHASSQFPYGHLAKVKGKPLLQQAHQQQWQQQQLHAGFHGPWELEDYLRNEFITVVQNRGAAVGKLRHQLSPALSAAAAVCCHVRDWLTGLPPGCDWVSMGVSSDGSYGIAAGLVYSFPVTCGKGSWAIVKGLPVGAWAWARMKAAEADLLEERNLALQVLAAATSRQRSAALAQQQHEPQVWLVQGRQPTAGVAAGAAQQGVGEHDSTGAAAAAPPLVAASRVRAMPGAAAGRAIPVQTAAEIAVGLQQARDQIVSEVQLTPGDCAAQISSVAQQLPSAAQAVVTAVYAAPEAPLAWLLPASAVAEGSVGSGDDVALGSAVAAAGSEGSGGRFWQQNLRQQQLQGSGGDSQGAEAAVEVCASAAAERSRSSSPP